VKTHVEAGGVMVHVVPPGFIVTTYDEGSPPPAPGATVTVKASLAVWRTTTDGAAGAASGVASTALLALEVPNAPVAVAVNEYWVPFVRFVTAHDVAGTVTVHVPFPGVAVTR
jgi:hypothetical protein